MRDYDTTAKNLREAAKGLLFDAMPYRASVMKDASDAIEELIGQHEADAKEIEWLKKCVQDLPKPPHWISVEERLPEEEKPVFVTYIGYNTGSLHSDMIAYQDGEGDWRCYDGDNGSDICKVDITHWMPLPEPPKGVE